MKQQSKRIQLLQLLYDTIVPLVNHDYVLIDLPYYDNIGDVLIWQGSEQLLNKVPHKCLYRASAQTYDYRPLAPDTIVLMQGGGNFGDIWTLHQDFRMAVIQKYPDNPIIILPQTVFYTNEVNLRNEAKVMRKHSNLTICVRDNVSYHTLKRYNVTEHLLLLPDMAFCIDPHSLQQWCLPAKAEQLLVIRHDYEFAALYDYKSYCSRDLTVEEKDWVSKSNANYPEWTELERLMQNGDAQSIDKYAIEVFRDASLRFGCHFLTPYTSVLTTRLHVFILSVILGKPVSLFDNKYGKNSSFYRTWFNGTDDCRLITSYRVRLNQWELQLKSKIKLLLNYHPRHQYE